jgi:hypothetical protein
MAITGPASYIPTMDEFVAHWRQCNTALGSQPLVVRRPESDTVVTRAQFVEMRDALQSQQGEVQSCRISQEMARGHINREKAALLKLFNLFTSVLNGYYVNTEFHEARPYAPSFTDGQEVFVRPLMDAVNLWEAINEGPAPAGVTLPLVLRGGTTQEDFAEAVEALKLSYAAEQRRELEVKLARAKRNGIQRSAYEVMKSYRETVPGICAEFPELVETMPRLTPLPGHTPAPVEANAVFATPNAARVVYTASDEATLYRYELRGNVGARYDESDAVVLATHGPNEAREFVTEFGLNSPGAQVALKVFVVLTTGNEAGSAGMVVERPVSEQLRAA